jgi:hypothetical protein
MLGYHGVSLVCVGIGQDNGIGFFHEMKGYWNSSAYDHCIIRAHFPSDIASLFGE